MSKKKNLLELSSFGETVKIERIKRNLSRDTVAETLGISVRYLAEIENVGKIPSLQVFYTLATMFNLSVDQYFYPKKAPETTSIRRSLDRKLDLLSDNELYIVDGTVTAILNIKK